MKRGRGHPLNPNPNPVLCLLLLSQSPLEARVCDESMASLVAATCEVANQWKSPCWNQCYHLLESMLESVLSLMKSLLESMLESVLSKSGDRPPRVQ